MTAFSRPYCIGLCACTVQSILLLFLSKTTETFSSTRLFMCVCCSPGSRKLLQLRNAERSFVNSAHSESVTRSLPMSTDVYWSSLHLISPSRPQNSPRSTRIAREFSQIVFSHLFSLLLAQPFHLPGPSRSKNRNINKTRETH